MCLQAEAKEGNSHCLTWEIPKMRLRVPRTCPASRMHRPLSTLNVSACVRVCSHVRVRVHVHVSFYMCGHVRVDALARVRVSSIHIHMYVYMYIHVYLNAYTCIYIYMYMCNKHVRIYVNL